MRRKLRRHLAFLMAVLMMLSLMGVQVLAEGVQVEAVQTTEGTDCTVLPEETDAEETSRSEMQKLDAKESPPDSYKGFSDSRCQWNNRIRSDCLSVASK